MPASSIAMVQIGFVRGGRKEPTDDDWNNVQARIELDSQQFSSDAMRGLDDFSHVEIIFHFNRVSDDEIQNGARHPRGRKDWPLVGIFAQRGKGRPNRIGVCVCAIERLDGLTLHVRGLDAIDGTPVLDIKPVMKGFLPRGEIHEPRWATELMQGYWSAT
jgi:tRNA-Thr(GGU) m(6)t(6)A37 methyltransferase TsaA